MSVSGSDNGGNVERNILIAVDASDNAKRAVQFVGDFFGCYSGINVALLNIILEPAAGYFNREEDREHWLIEQRRKADRVLDDYRRMLIDSGLPPERVHAKIEVRRAASVAECILEEQERMKYCTVVIGRRGISQKEEFIFGSTSNKIIHHATNCAVMVIE